MAVENPRLVEEAFKIYTALLLQEVPPELHPLLHDAYFAGSKFILFHVLDKIASDPSVKHIHLLRVIHEELEQFQVKELRRELKRD